MCGIVGAAAQREVKAILLEGLRRLEYRGYDSAGIALLDTKAQLLRERVKGKVNDLVKEISQSNLSGQTGIAHTRWATHGKPSQQNAHPHFSDDTIGVVHNGIIENHEHLRDRLKSLGYPIQSETDSELIAHLIHHEIELGKDLLVAIKSVISNLEGAYALGIISRLHPHRLIAVCQGSPLIIGLGFEENFFASDPIALLPVTTNFITLADGEIADVSFEAVQIYNNNLKSIEKKCETFSFSIESTNRGQYRHYMQKEIFEQPDALRMTLKDKLADNRVLEEAFGIDASKLFDKTKAVHIVACGTSYHAGLVAKYWLEGLAGVPCLVEIASEYRYRKPVVQHGTLLVAISQSGETADTLAVLNQAEKKNYVGILTICNVASSAMVRISDVSILTKAGPEIGVASTKAFTTQLAALLLLTITIGRRHNLSESTEAVIVDELKKLPNKVEEVLRLDESIQLVAQKFGDKNHSLFLGRGIHSPIALEGALKLKEISYIHAEGYAAGELKHGPLALVDKQMPVVALAPNDELLGKMKSNLHEVHARGGELIVFTEMASTIKNAAGITVINLPSCADVIAPIIYTLPLQMLAYHVALIKGTDVDQPRNLAKSVTVE